MQKQISSQRGQALVLVALAIIGLVGFAALSIDGSHIFSDRRHSQNASDTAAYAAALAYIRTPLGNWKQAGIDRAANNGYSSTDGVTEVDVYLCSELPKVVNGRTLECEGLPNGADPADYVYVHIKSLVKLFFAPVIGWRQVFNHTHAVVLASTEQETSFFPGYALVSTMLGCPPYPHDPFKVEGTSLTTIINAGILVNSDCQDPDPAYDQRNATSTVKTDTGVCVTGDYDFRIGGTVPPPTHCEPIDVSKYVLPNPECSHEGKIVEDPQHPGTYTAFPGLYGRNFNFDSIVDVNPSGTLKLQKGIYCFYNGLDVNSQWTITTDWNGNHQYDSASEGVFFYVPSGDITFNGSPNIDIHAIDSTVDGFPKEYVNYLMYVPPTNPNDIIITGGSGSQFTGTILAPNSYIRLNGGSGTVGLNSQVIGYSVALEGNGTLNIHYNANQNATTTYNPSLTGIE